MTVMLFNSGVVWLWLTTSTIIADLSKLSLFSISFELVGFPHLTTGVVFLAGLLVDCDKCKYRYIHNIFSCCLHLERSLV